MTKRTTKHSLLMSVISLLLCFSMLLGTTWAWFTDSVESKNNKIQSGTLKVDLELLDKETGTWSSVKTDNKPLFNYDKWEPGYTEVKVLKVENEGKLALKWQAQFVTDHELTILANAIDVYVKPYGVLADASAVTYPTRGLEGYTKVGTIADFVNTIKTTTVGELLEGQAAYLGLALKMREEAGNEYQGLNLVNDNVNGTFDIRIFATQYTAEDDSFGIDYDKDAFFPTGNVNVSISAPVVVGADNKLAEQINLGASGEIGAVIPQGVLLDDGATHVTLKVTELDTTDRNIQVNAGEQARSVDVHVDGVSENNDKPIIVTIPEFMPIGLNMGNYTLYHVENSTPTPMTFVATPDEHNEFSYDPATGDVVMALKSFSEISTVAEEAMPWEGGFDYTWYDNNPEAEEFVIANADQLAAFGALVGSMRSKDDPDNFITFKGKTVKLVADINLGITEAEEENKLVFYPIGYHNSTGSYEKTDTAGVVSQIESFEGIFDGQGHTIKNFYQNTWEMFGDYNDGYPANSNHYKDAMGLFGYVYNGTVKNLTVDNFSSDGEFAPTGVITAYAAGNSNFENIAITNCNPRVYNTGNGGIVGILGNNDETGDNAGEVYFTNITIDNTNKITALWGTWDGACGGIAGMYRGRSKINLTNCHVGAQIDAFNDVCGNYQYYWYRYSAMLIAAIRTDTTDANGYIIPDTSTITATDCTVHFGTWNDYYYCELVDNSLASYTHDHQMSRLVQVQSVDTEKATYVDLNGKTNLVPPSGRANYVVVADPENPENAECFHFLNGEVWNHEDAGEETVNGESVLKEDKQHVYLPFNQVYQGWGWGVKNIAITDDDDIPGVTILKRIVADSETKFRSKVDGDPYYRTTEKTITIGELFAAIENAVIKTSGVWVSVEKVGENSTVSGTFARNDADWTQGTLTLSGGGLAKITIQDYYYCTPTTIIINVVDLDAAPTGLSSGYNGNILGLLEDKTYEVVPVVLNSAGDGMKLLEDQITSNVTTGTTGLAGLYKARFANGESKSDWSEMFYVYGEKDNRADVGHDETDYLPITSTNDFTVGNWASKTLTHKTAAGANSLSHGDGWFGGHWNNNKIDLYCAVMEYNVAKALLEGKTGESNTALTFVNTQIGLINTVDDNHTNVKAKMEAIVTKYSPLPTITEEEVAEVKSKRDTLFATVIDTQKFDERNSAYAYEPDEIININELNTFTYSTYRRMGSYNYTNYSSAVEVYVTDMAGKVTSYKYTTPADNKLSVAAVETVDFKNKAAWTPALPDTGYVVGIKIYPWVGINNPDNLTVENVIDNAACVLAATMPRIIIARTAFTVSNPILPKLEGVEGGFGEIKGLVDGAVYQYAEYSINASGTGLAMGEWTDLDREAIPSGLISLRKYVTTEDDVPLYTAASDMFYVYGDSEKRAEVGRDDNKIISASSLDADLTNNFVTGRWTSNTDKRMGTGESSYLSSSGNGWFEAAKIKNMHRAQVKYYWAKALYEGRDPEKDPVIVALKANVDTANATATANPSVTAVINAYNEIDGVYEELKNITTVTEDQLAEYKAARDVAFKPSFDAVAIKAVNYAYNPDEIISISELKNLAFYTYARQNSFSYPAFSSVYEVFIADLDGKVKSYKYTTNAVDLGNASKRTVDFTDTNGWTPALPSQGYVVAAKVYLWAGITDYDSFIFTPNYERTDTNQYLNSMPSFYLKYDNSRNYVYEINASIITEKLTGIEGGYGEIKGLVDGAKYQYAEYTINSTGEGLAMGEWNVLNANNPPAGLISLRKFVATFEEKEIYTLPSDMIYVYGSKADRENVFTANVTSGNVTKVGLSVYTNANGQFYPGAWTNKYSTYLESYTSLFNSNSDIKGFGTAGADISAQKAHALELKYRLVEALYEGNGTAETEIRATINAQIAELNALLASGTVTTANKTNVQNTIDRLTAILAIEEADESDYTDAKNDYDSILSDILARARTVSMKYAYNPDEIININELSYFKIGVGRRYTSFTYSKLFSSDVKVYVADKNGVVTPYTFTTEPKTKLSVNSDTIATYEISLANKEAWSDELPDEGYVVGIEVFPWAGMTKVENISVINCYTTDVNGNIFLNTCAKLTLPWTNANGVNYATPFDSFADYYGITNPTID